MERQVGLSLAADGVAELAPVLRGQQILTRPYQRGRLLVGTELVLDEPRMLAIAPVSDEQGKVIAAFFTDEFFDHMGIYCCNSRAQS